MKEFYVVRALLKLTKTEDGDRKTGILSGYRPNHVFEYRPSGDMVAAYMGDIRYDGEEFILPGEQKVVTVRLLREQPIEKYLKTGGQWWIHEGPRCVGVAEIIEIQS
jgi:translation elongation factor EF-Tu-like GTPase